MENFGYNLFFETNRNQLGLADFPVARVISEHKEAYKVKNTNGEYLAKITGKLLPMATMIKRKYGNKNKSGEKNRQFGKFKKKVMKELKNFIK